VLDRLVARSVALLAADAAGIMLADARGQLRVVASSSEESDSTELLSVGDSRRSAAPSEALPPHSPPRKGLDPGEDAVAGPAEGPVARPV